MATKCKYHAPTRAFRSFRLGGYKMGSRSCGGDLAAAASSRTRSSLLLLYASSTRTLTLAARHAAAVSFAQPASLPRGLPPRPARGCRGARGGAADPRRPGHAGARGACRRAPRRRRRPRNGRSWRLPAPIYPLRPGLSLSLSQFPFL